MSDIRQDRRVNTVVVRDDGGYVSLEILKPAEFFAPENRPKLVGLRMISYVIDQDLRDYITDPSTSTQGIAAFSKLIDELGQAVRHEMKKRDHATAG